MASFGNAKLLIMNAVYNQSQNAARRNLQTASSLQIERLEQRHLMAAVTIDFEQPRFKIGDPVDVVDDVAFYSGPGVFTSRIWKSQVDERGYGQIASSGKQLLGAFYTGDLVATSRADLWYRAGAYVSAESPLESVIMYAADEQNKFFGRVVSRPGAKSQFLEILSPTSLPRIRRLYFSTDRVDTNSTWHALAVDDFFYEFHTAPTLGVYVGSPSQIQSSKFFITTGNDSVVRMPQLTYELGNLPAGTDPTSLRVKWTTVIKNTLDAPGTHTLKDFVIVEDSIGTKHKPKWTEIRGGNLQITAQFSVSGESFTISSGQQQNTKDIRILGRNPTKGQIQAFINNFRPPANWPANSGFDYSSILRKIAYHETDLPTMGSGGYNQFYRTGRYAGQPTWNEGGDGGVGVMQITDKIVKPANVWDWRSNIIAGVQAFNDKLRVAATYPQTIKTFSSYTSAVDRYNQLRIAQGLQPLIRVDVPAWTARQRVLVAIRAYNGATGIDSIGTRILNEYELATTGKRSNMQLALDVNESSLVGAAKWVRVPTDLRLRSKGEPNYVQKVLDSSDA